MGSSGANCRISEVPACNVRCSSSGCRQFVLFLQYDRNISTLFLVRDPSLSAFRIFKTSNLLMFQNRVSVPRRAYYCCSFLQALYLLSAGYGRTGAQKKSNQRRRDQSCESLVSYKPTKLKHRDSTKHNPKYVQLHDLEGPQIFKNEREEGREVVS